MTRNKALPLVLGVGAYIALGLLTWLGFEAVVKAHGVNGLRGLGASAGTNTWLSVWIVRDSRTNKLWRVGPVYWPTGSEAKRYLVSRLPPGGAASFGLAVQQTRGAVYIQSSSGAIRTFTAANAAELSKLGLPGGSRLFAAIEKIPTWR